MSVMTKAEAKKFSEMEDYFLDLLNFLKDKEVIDAALHRRILLTGFDKLVDCLQEKKLINGKQAKEAMNKGFTSLVASLAG